MLAKVIITKKPLIILLLLFPLSHSSHTTLWTGRPYAHASSVHDTMVVDQHGMCLNTARHQPLHFGTNSSPSHSFCPLSQAHCTKNLRVGVDSMFSPSIQIDTVEIKGSRCLHFSVVCSEGSPSKSVYLVPSSNIVGKRKHPTLNVALQAAKRFKKWSLDVFLGCDILVTH